MTSRLGLPKIWNRMKGCQKVVLQSLNEVDSMVYYGVRFTGWILMMLKMKW